MIRGIYISLLLAIVARTVTVSSAAAASTASAAGNDVKNARLTGIYVKDGNENGQLRFLAAGLNGNTNNNNGLNAALNQYITNKQDMLEQLRPTNTNNGLGLGSGLGSGFGTGFGTGSTNGNNAIYVSLGGGGSVTGTTNTGTSATGTGTGLTNQQIALNQVAYGSTPINNLLPQIIGQSVAQRQGVAGGNNNRRGTVQRRRVVNNNGNRRRRKGNKGKNGNKRPQVVVLRPNQG